LERNHKSKRIRGMAQVVEQKYEDLRLSPNNAKKKNQEPIK
jgi:hypothetical protein